jgi:hypothetical protein
MRKFARWSAKLLMGSKIRWVEVVMKNVEKLGRTANRDNAQNLGEYYTLIVSLTVFCLCLFISTAVFRTPVSQFVVTIEKTIASAGRR